MKILAENIDENMHKVFRLVFLKNDENCYVEVEEVEEMDLTKIIERLERGESIFMSPRRKQESSQKNAC